MEPDVLAAKTITLSHAAFYRAIGGSGAAGLPSDDEPLPPGPWDPVVRAALRRLVALPTDPVPWRTALWTALPQDPIPVRLARVLAEVAGPLPDPWRSAFAEVMLNPQPLPPRWVLLAAITDEVIQQAELMVEMTGGLLDDGGERGIIIVGGYVGRFVDDWCGNSVRLPKWPRPRRWDDPPPRPEWQTSRLDGHDLLAVGSGLAGAATRAVPGLSEVFADAAARLADRAAGML